MSAIVFAYIILGIVWCGIWTFAVIGVFYRNLRRPLFVFLTLGLLFTLFIIAAVLSYISTKNDYCANSCHSVVKPYVDAWQKTNHANASCYSCHGYKGIVQWVYARGREVVLNSSGSYEKPINKNGELSEEMSSEACESCHVMPKKIMPSEGILINHSRHAEKGINCTACHNRIAHAGVKEYLGKMEEKRELAEKLATVTASLEKVGLTFTVDDALKLPWDKGVGEPKLAYADYMDMEYCMKCHNGGSGKKEAPKDCKTCHPEDFKLKPTSHEVADFLRAPSGERAVHTKMARVDKALEMKYCNACHLEKFCTDCHGLEIPHPEKDFVGGKNEHASVGRTNPKVCQNCHPEPNFCKACHHKDWNPAKGPWTSAVAGQTQHKTVVQEKGAKPCFTCHNPVDCSHCHITGEFILHPKE